MASGFPAARWVALSAVALAEYLVVALLADGRLIAERFALIVWAPRLVGLAVAVATSAIALGGAGLVESWQRLQLAPPRAPLGRALLHGALYLGFVGLTVPLFAAPARFPGGLALWLSLWAALGLGTLLSLLAVALPLAGAAALLWGARRGLSLALGMGALAFAAGQSTNMLWGPMSKLALYLSAAMLRLMGANVVMDTSRQLLGTPGFQVQIAPECSGLEGLGLMLALLTGWLVWRRHQLRFPQALALLPLGALVAIVSNGMRIAALVLVGAGWNANLAVGAFHSRAGWVLFCAAALGLTALSIRSPFFARPETLPPHHGAGGEPDASDNPTAVWLGPLVAAIATALFTGLFTSGLDYLYPLRLVAAGLLLWQGRASLPRLSVSGWPLLAGAALFLLWMTLSGAPDGDADAQFARGLAALPPGARLAGLAVRTAGSVLLIPLIEEMAFRGFLLRRLIDADFTAVDFGRRSLPAILISSLAFGALDQHLVLGTLAGLLFALLQGWRGRFWDAVLAHATTNALIAAAVLAGSRWDLWR